MGWVATVSTRRQRRYWRMAVCLPCPSAAAKAATAYSAQSAAASPSADARCRGDPGRRQVPRFRPASRGRVPVMIALGEDQPLVRAQGHRPRDHRRNVCGWKAAHAALNHLRRFLRCKLRCVGGVPPVITTAGTWSGSPGRHRRTGDLRRAGCAARVSTRMSGARNGQRPAFRMGIFMACVAAGHPGGSHRRGPQGTHGAARAFQPAGRQHADRDPLTAKDLGAFVQQVHDADGKAREEAAGR